MPLLKPTPPSSPREWRLLRSPHSCSRPRPRVLAPCIGLWTSWSSGTKPYEYRWPTSRRSRAGWRVSKPRCVSTRRAISSSCLSCIKLRSPVGPQHPTSGSSTPRRERHPTTAAATSAWCSEACSGSCSASARHSRSRSSTAPQWRPTNDGWRIAFRLPPEPPADPRSRPSPP